MTDVNEFAGTSLGASLRPASAGSFPDRHSLGGWATAMGVKLKAIGAIERTILLYRTLLGP